jgi:GT2 family glycosyltransferase
LQQLESVLAAPAGTWQSQGTDPHFVMLCRLPAGWVRIRLQMACADRARVEIRVDVGSGWDATLCVERADFCGTLDRDFFVRLPCAIHGVRLDPLDREGQFRLDKFHIERVTRLGVLVHAFSCKLKLLLTHGRTWRAVGNGLGLLARGRFGRVKHKLLGALKGPSPLATPLEDAQHAYDAWRRRRQFTNTDRHRLRAEAAAMAHPPLISVILPPAGASERELELTIQSIRRQTYRHWELCLAASDWNAALAQARGDYVAVIDPGDELAEQAFFRVAQAVVADRGQDMLYSDEDSVEADGRHVNPFFKPNWSPEYSLSGQFPGRLGVYRTGLVRELGGFRSTLDEAQEYDLALRIAAKSSRIGHITDILYHRQRAPAPATAATGRRALEDYLAATGRRGQVEPGPRLGTHRVRLTIAGCPRVSIIIATAYRKGTFGGVPATFVGRCLASVRARTTYRHYEVLVLDDPEAAPEERGELKRWRVLRLPYEKPFNWAAAMNRGAARAAGDYLLFLNDDTEIITTDWLECLLEFAQQPEIGAVGARLEFPDGRLQHVGVNLLHGVPRHPFHGFPGSHPGHFLSSLVPRNYSAVTGACLMTRADVFHALGGFTEAFALNFNDIDYCLRVVARCRRVVCNPYARLLHHEAATKPGVFEHEVEAFKNRWGRQWSCDPFYNPNLSTRANDYRVDPDRVI